MYKKYTLYSRKNSKIENPNSNAITSELDNFINDKRPLRYRTKEIVALRRTLSAYLQTLFPHTAYCVQRIADSSISSDGRVLKGR